MGVEVAIGSTPAISKVAISNGDCIFCWLLYTNVEIYKIILELEKYTGVASNRVVLKGEKKDKFRERKSRMLSTHCTYQNFVLVLGHFIAFKKCATFLVTV